MPPYVTAAHVSLAAIRQNLAGIRARVGPERLVLMAVKANAYGHGAVAVSRMLQRTGAADWVGVATVGEGIELREAGVTLPILKFSPVFADEATDAVRADLRLPLADAGDVEMLRAAASALGQRAVVHLKVDTGMGRVGVTPAGAADLARAVAAAAPHLHLEGIFTHLAVADSPAQDQFTAEQLARLARCVESVQAGLGRRVELIHAANSGGVLAHEASWLSMVRPGIMTYGYRPDPGTPATVPLQPALTWTSRVSFVKHVPAGTSIGYGRTWVAPRDTWIGTVPIGYGDGFSRALSGTGRFLVGGTAYPVVGRVCMDQTMFDIGPEPSVRVGETVTVLGADGGASYWADDMAADLGTIPYEITCRIDARVHREHGEHGEDGEDGDRRRRLGRPDGFAR